MKNWIAALSVSLALSTLPMGVFAHGYDPGDAALGGFVGGAVGGLIGSGRVPVVVAPARPVVVEPYYAPTLVVVEPYGARTIYYRGGHRGWYGGRGWHGHHYHHHHDDD